MSFSSSVRLPARIPLPTAAPDNLFSMFAHPDQLFTARRYPPTYGFFGKELSIGPITGKKHKIRIITNE
jgi:hypothetical protein